MPASPGRAPTIAAVKMEVPAESSAPIALPAAAGITSIASNGVEIIAPARALPAPCTVTPSSLQRKTSSIEKVALGNGPWIINDDRTIWASDQPYVANRPVTTVWIRPANTELVILAKRLDGDTPQLHVGPAEPLQTAYVAIGVTFPAPGCWEVTATAGTSTLTFVTRVRE
jgi:hypothetical protein